VKQPQGGFLQFVILAIVALAILVPLGVIFVVEAFSGHSFTAPDALTSLALVVVTFFFAHGSFLGQQTSTAGLISSVASAIGSNGSSSTSVAPTPVSQNSPGTPNSGTNPQA